MNAFRLLVVPVALCAAALFPGGTAAADAPVKSVVDFPIDEVVPCDGFEATIVGEGIERSLAFSDTAGVLQRLTLHTSAPADVWTNTTTGKSIVVRGNFVQTYERIPGTDDFTVTIKGFRYMVNQPGRGVIVQEVGRITYADPSEPFPPLTQAGQHDLADSAGILPTFCGAIAA